MKKCKLIYRWSDDVYELWIKDDIWRKVSDYYSKLSNEIVIKEIGSSHDSELLIWDIDIFIRAGYEFIGIEHRRLEVN